MKRIRRILLFKIGAIGDVLMTTPLIRALRLEHPQAQIDYLVGRWSAAALDGNPHLSHVISFSDNLVREKQLVNLIKLMLEMRTKHYDAIFILDRAWQVGLLSMLMGSRRYGFNRGGEGVFHTRVVPYNPKSTGKVSHNITYNLKLGTLVGCDTSNTDLELALSAADKQFAENALRQAAGLKVAITPGGANNPYQHMSARRWPHYRSLTAALDKRGDTVIVCGSKTDTEAAEIKGKSVINLVGQTTLKQTAAVMQAASVIIAHDSGPMHIAVTTQTPIIALFGPTDPRRTKPLGDQHRIIWHAARPCHHEGRLSHCRPEHNLENVSVEEVVETIDSMTS